MIIIDNVYLIRIAWLIIGGLNDDQILEDIKGVPIKITDDIQDLASMIQIKRPGLLERVDCYSNEKLMKDFEMEIETYKSQERLGNTLGVELPIAEDPPRPLTSNDRGLII